MGRLEGQVAIITGGASGIGKAVMERYVAEGAYVVAVDRPGKRTDALRDAKCPQISVVAGDVRDLATNEAAVDAAIERYGRLDVLVANAGIFDAHTRLGDIEAERLTDAANEIFAVNVLAYLLGSRAALAPLTESHGAMIFTVSPAGTHPSGGGVLYTASKHAVVGIVRRLAFELAPTVRVNGVAPGGTATDIRGPAALGLAERSISGSRLRNESLSDGPQVVGIEPTDHAGTYVYLACRADSPATTGQIIETLGAHGVAPYYNPRTGH
ncbi:SDR family NAD(P)-dependent oxidoreductase [Nocardia gipuzkoensis]|uniref:SDR family NAD(P)-dependent oxidoreductase n=1 Tax=Nocardia gipuzkoensis TaxID=2749991 RepID=UPI00237D755D|nr:SDR family NAD(P)-dependent oxidoreductase [Nocardia gipuzkoensis]MDE1675478.1 SDR family NAD(P)-dependent oxidoreductase [Nocardia gipuzkoensis]